MSDLVQEQPLASAERGDYLPARRWLGLIDHPSLMLVVVTLLWGISFPWTKHWQEEAIDCPGGAVLSSLTLIGLRMPLAMLFLAVWQPRVYRRPAWRDHLSGMLLGVTFFAGFLPQTVGLAYTTPALSAFFTGLACAWAPLFGWLLFRVPLPRLMVLGLVLAFAGMAILVEGGWRLGYGDVLTIVASFAFAAQLLVLDHLGRVMSPAHLTPGFFGSAAVLGLSGAVIYAATGPGLCAWAAWIESMLSRPAVACDLVLLALLPGLLSFHWMNTYQPLVPPGRVALIYLLEPVFSSVFSVVLGYDQVTATLLIGGSMILAGNRLVERPGILYRKALPGNGPRGP